LLYKKGPLDLQDLAASRLQICMQDALMRGVRIREANARVLPHAWFSCTLTVLCEALILGQP
jgi:hypothetical protein